VRFDAAREAGLQESTVAQIEDGYEKALDPAQTAALVLTDAIITNSGALSPDQQERLKAHFSDAEIAEIALGVGLFHGMSKVLICLGLEPEEMDTTILPTPGS
jgi:alkylhydroperoxidase family enzyme